MHRRVLAEVPLEANGPHAAVSLVDPLEPGEGAVAGAVVDEDDLVGPSERVEGRDRPPVELVDAPLLVEDGDDDRQVGRGSVLVKAPRHGRGASLRHLQRELTPGRRQARLTPPRRCAMLKEGRVANEA